MEYNLILVFYYYLRIYNNLYVFNCGKSLTNTIFLTLYEYYFFLLYMINNLNYYEYYLYLN